MGALDIGFGDERDAGANVLRHLGSRGVVEGVTEQREEEMEGGEEEQEEVEEAVVSSLSCAAKRKPKLSSRRAKPKRHAQPLDLSLQLDTSITECGHKRVFSWQVVCVEGWNPN